MTIDIRGTTTKNKGAQLMLDAVVARLGERYQLSAAPAVLDYSVRARHGLHQTIHLNRFPGASAKLGRLVPAEVRRRYGLVADSELSGVVDASGFAYSDSFGPRIAKQEATYGRGWSRRGIPKVILPQAFGPFSNDQVASYTRELLNQAQIVFARDRVSASHLKRLGLSVEVRLSPDFTIGLAPSPSPLEIDGAYAAIVPNKKLMTQGIATEGQYVEMLERFGRSARAEGLLPLLVIHETGDRTLAESVARRLGAPTFESDDPRTLKGVIAGADLLVASRFHAVVGGLSQSVPTIAIGWSHKYKELLEDFSVPDWISGPDVDADQVIRKVLTDTEGHRRLRDAKVELVAQVDLMWNMTETILR